MLRLRWTLLILGVLFLAGMALFESVRGRRNRATGPGRLAGGEPPPRASPPADLRDKPEEVPLPSFSARDPERARLDGPLPVYELPAEAPAAGRRLDPILDFDAGADLAGERAPRITEPALASAEAPAAVPVAQLREIDAAAGAATGPGGAPAGSSVPVDDFEIGPVRVVDAPAAAWPGSAAAAPAVMEPEPEAMPVAAPAAEAPPVLLPPVTEPIVEWPDPERSQVLSLRVLAPREKFQGRAVRLALTAQGFLPGRFSIYHKAAPDGRAVLSVASLTKPGTFEDPPRGDMQRFSGLNLFTVLPGPLPPAEAVEELLQVAGTLAARLQGQLTDDRGEPLSAPRVQELRAMATAQAS